MDSHAWLKGSPTDRPNPSRVVHDVEIGGGYMHSGYPVRLGGPASQAPYPAPPATAGRQAATQGGAVQDGQERQGWAALPNSRPPSCPPPPPPTPQPGRQLTAVASAAPLAHRSS
jgi:hypothetical protein